jgi:hypothetical protein
MPEVGGEVEVFFDDPSWTQQGQYLLIGIETLNVFTGGLFRVVDKGSLSINVELVAYDQNATVGASIPVGAGVVIGGRPDQSDLALQYAGDALASRNQASGYRDEIQNNLSQILFFVSQDAVSVTVIENSLATLETGTDPFPHVKITFP